MLLRLCRVEPLRGSPLSYCRPHRRLPIRSVDRHHHIAAFVLLALRFTYIRILSITVAILRHGGVLHCLLRRHAIAAPAALLFDDLPSRPRCSRRFVLSIRRHGRAVRFDRRAVTMMICPSEGHVIRRRVGTYCRSASRPGLAVCAADVLRCYPTRYRLIATPRASRL